MDKHQCLFPIFLVKQDSVFTDSMQNIQYMGAWREN